LMDIEEVKAVVEKTTLSPAAQAELRHKARVRSTHYSTRIEGNRLTLKEAEKVIAKQKERFHGRERDVSEVRNYWDGGLEVLNESNRARVYGLAEKYRKFLV
jgi:hypothetical protein